MVEHVDPYMDDLSQMGWMMHKGVIEEEAKGQMGQEFTEFLKEKRMEVISAKSLDSQGTGSILGLRFDQGELSVHSKLAKFTKGDLMEMMQKMTRGKAFSLLSSFYDVLGLFGEIQMLARMLANKLAGLAWDKPIPVALAVDITSLVKYASS